MSSTLIESGTDTADRAISGAENVSKDGRRINAPRPSATSVDFIVPIHSASLTLATCLDAISRSTIVPSKVIIVDDWSIDQGPEIAKAHRIVSQVIRTDSNRGKSHAVNLGLRHSSADFVVVCDPDVVIATDLIKKWLDAFEADSRLGVAGAYVYYVEPEGRLTHAGAIFKGFPARIQRLHENELDNGLSNRPIVDPWLVVDDVYAIRSETLRVTGPFQEDLFPMMLEDADLQWRIRRAGYRLAIVPGAKARHIQRFTKAGRFSHYSSRKMSLTLRNRLVLFRRHTYMSPTEVWLTAIGGLVYYSAIGLRQFGSRTFFAELFPMLMKSTLDGLQCPIQRL